MLSKPTLLTKEHDLTDFDCGTLALNDWLRKFALSSQKSGSANTFVVCDENRVVAFYSLATGALDHAEATPRVVKGQAKYPIPIVLIARLAVDKDYQGKGLGQWLMKDAFLRTLQAASEGPAIRAIVVQAKDEKAKVYYQEKFEFEPSPIDDMKLMLLLKDVRRSLEKAVEQAQGGNNPGDHQ